MLLNSQLFTTTERKRSIFPKMRNGDKLTAEPAVPSHNPGERERERKKNEKNKSDFDTIACSYRSVCFTLLAGHKRVQCNSSVESSGIWHSSAPRPSFPPRMWVSHWEYTWRVTGSLSLFFLPPPSPTPIYPSLYFFFVAPSCLLAFLTFLSFSIFLGPCEPTTTITTLTIIFEFCLCEENVEIVC